MEQLTSQPAKTAQNGKLIGFSWNHELQLRSYRVLSQLEI
jgi:hypothetical protein